MIRYSTFPRTKTPPEFTDKVVNIFKNHYSSISTVDLEKGLTSDETLAMISKDLLGIGFEVEMSKLRDDKIYRPVLFGENGVPIMKYEIDAYHNEWKCGIEVEAGRATMGNAIYRDIVQSLVMVNLDYLILAVPISYKYNSRRCCMKVLGKACANIHFN
jgi:hypothetical protein